MQIGQVTTPAALVDRKRIERNTQEMSERMTRLGVSLRPHVKTHKCKEAALLQVHGHNGGITVSTLAEAKGFAKEGFRDITYAYPFPITRLTEIEDLQKQVDRLNLVLDQETSLEVLEKRGGLFRIYLEVDCGDHRCGVDPQKKESIDLAKRIATSPVIDFQGILTHGGHSYLCKNEAEIRKAAAEERDIAVQFASQLREEGISVPEVSIGSTPTMRHVDHLEGITEVRPGNYVFFDAFQDAIGSCSIEEISFSVLTRIVGTYPEQNKMIVDAGALALSKDPGPTHIDPQCGYGIVCTLKGTPIPELKIRTLSQEHGQIFGTKPIDWKQFPVGEALRIIPNHSCLTSALHHLYHLFDEQEITEAWRPIRGW
jgi:D-serine deaminase-like pyridoxal phosphate-dependent protein